MFSLGGSKRTKIYIATLLIIVAALLAANFDYPVVFKDVFDRDYTLGLDLQGGIHLVYEADLSKIERSREEEAMAALRDAIERRVNFLGVSEPVVQVERGPESSRLIVELAGINDPNRAIEEIGKTPFLEFKEEKPTEAQTEAVNNFINEFPDVAAQTGIDQNPEAFCQTAGPQLVGVILQLSDTDPCYNPTNLTGQYLDNAAVVTDQTTGQIQISLQFDSEGAELFKNITERNIGKTLAIYLDGAPISTPVVNQAIPNGQAIITGNFTIEEARELVRNLNAGALPVPIEIISQQRVGASLGAESLQKSLTAAAVALVAVLLFLIIIYRFSGLLAVFSLLIYLVFLLAFIKFIPVTLTLAGVAGLILSLGMAVDANILVFERLREEIKERDVKNMGLAVDNAFSRAWPSIRDGNVSTLLTAFILFWFSTSFVQGFALVLGMGILISMFSAMIITKYFIKIFLQGRLSKLKWLWSR